MKRTNTIIMTTVILSIALTTVFAFDLKTNNIDSLNTQIPLTADAVSDDTHNITMEVVVMSDDIYAYRMIEYAINDGDDLELNILTSLPFLDQLSQ